MASAKDLAIRLRSSFSLFQSRVAIFGRAFAVAVTATPVLAAPSIYSIEGVLLPGSQIKITGEGFSAEQRGFDLKASSGSYFLSTLDNAIQTLEPNDFWMNRGSSWASPLVLVDVEEAGRVHSVYQGKGKTYNQYIEPLNSATNDTLYISWLYKPSESPGHSGGSNKFIRVWDNHDGNDTRISWTGMHMTYSGYTKASWAGWSGTVNEWNRMELWVDGPGGRIEARINGKIVHNVTDFIKKPNGMGLNIKLLGFDPSSATPYVNMITQIDDLYLGTTRARVVLSHKSKWADTHHKGEIQLPIKWDDSEISLKLSFGGLDPAEKIYLYVVDKNGIANASGYELCAYCPLAPQLTSK